MLRKNVEKALNNQLNAEFYSAYLYLAMTAYFEHVNLQGFAHWMRLQAQEELMHALKFYDYINERDGRVALASIDKPTMKWESPLKTFQAAYRHEEEITERISDLMNLAVKEGDHATQIFLQWFVTEQVEELASSNAVIEQLKLVEDSPNGLFLIDRELANRSAEGPSE